MHGIYRIYKNNELVSESKNLITSNGKNIIHEYLAGTIGDWASTIGIGAYNTTAATTDYKLNYEITRLPITGRYPVDSTIVSTTVSGSSGAYTVGVSSSTGLAVGYALAGTGIRSDATVVITGISGSTVTLSHSNASAVSGTGTFRSPKSVKLKATVPKELGCIIYELGIFTTNRNTGNAEYDDKILSNFDESIDSTGWTSGSSISSYSLYSPRLASKTVAVTASTTSQSIVIGYDNNTIPIGTASSPAGRLSINTAMFSNNYDTAKMLLYSTGTASITIKAQDDTTITTASPTNYVTLFSNVSVASGVNLIESTISKGTYYNDNLSKIEISYITPSGSVRIDFDSLKFSSNNSYFTYYGLVSRSVLNTPITKTSDETVDIEYEIYLYS